MDESYCRCPGCGECSAHANAPKLKAEIKRLKSQRTWVGLTDDEICSLEGFYDFMTKEDFFKAIHAVEAKLKERNT